MRAHQTRLLTFFDVQPSEGRLVILVLLYTILLYAANMLVYTSAYSLFLATYDATALPYIYIGVSIVASSLAFFYLRLNKRFALAPLLVGNLLFLVLTLLGYWLGVRFGQYRWLIFTLPIYYGVVNTITLTAFWSLLGRLFSLQQGKRLFGLLTAGEHIATISMGFLTPFIVQWTGANNLLFVAALIATGAVALLGYLTYAYRELFNAPEVRSEVVTESHAPHPEPLGTRDTYLLLSYGVFILYILGLYFVNNIFYGQVETHYHNADQLAAFLSLLYGIVGVGSLLMQSLIAGRLTQRLGARRLLLILPGFLLIMIGFFFISGVATTFTRLLFWLAVLASCGCTLLDAITWSAVNLLYQPLPPLQRTRIQTTVTGILYPLSIGLAGLLLFTLSKLLQWNAVQLAGGLLLIVFGWLFIALWLGRAYPRKLRQILAARTAQTFAGIPTPVPNLPGFKQASLTTSASEISDLLDLWEEAAPEQVAAILGQLLGHTLPEVRLDVYQRIERLRLTALLPAIRQHLQTETAPAIQTAALRALVAHGERTHQDELASFMPNPYSLEQAGG
ncbi:MAG: MFS transporter [Caldilineaceae bacterium]